MSLFVMYCCMPYDMCSDNHIFASFINYLFSLRANPISLSMHFDVDVCAHQGL